jgi:hypothetical protein
MVYGINPKGFKGTFSAVFFLREGPIQGDSWEFF